MTHNAISQASIYWTGVPYFLVSTFFYLRDQRDLTWYIASSAGNMILITLGRGDKVSLEQSWVWMIVAGSGVLMILFLPSVYLNILLVGFITLMSMMYI